jgi:hypothetical protein
MKRLTIGNLPLQLVCLLMPEWGCWVGYGWVWVGGVGGVPTSGIVSKTKER